jgi:hypothetical protein
MTLLLPEVDLVVCPGCDTTIDANDPDVATPCVTWENSDTPTVCTDCHGIICTNRHCPH